MSSVDYQFTHSSNSQSSSQSNIHYGDNNHGNEGHIGDGCGNVVAKNNVGCNFFTKVTCKGESELDRLLYPDISRDALHDSLDAPTTCHPGTRKTVCKAIKEWTSNPAGSPLLWLYGPAGVGKSVIAKTISTIAANQVPVVATFFFSTSSDKRAATLFPTLAWQLAKNVPETEQYIVAALNRNRLLPKSQLELQFDQLINRPLRNCKVTGTCLLMVIDGVDECIDENIRVEFLNVIKRAGERGDLPLRFLICSRPEPRIRAILETNSDDYSTAKSETKSTPKFSTTPDIPKSSAKRPDNTGQPGYTIASPKQQKLSLRYQVWIKIEPYLPDVTLAKAQLEAQLDALRQWRPRHFTALPSDAWMLFQPMQLGVNEAHSSSEIQDELDKVHHRQVISRIQIGLSEESKDDIRIYLTDKFNKNRVSDGDQITSADIDELVSKSCGQFLYASIIVKLLDSSDFSPHEVLKMAHASSLPSPDLDKLYGAILDQAQKSMWREHVIDGEIDFMTLRNVFAILIVLWENVQLANIPESFPVIEYLLGLEEARLKRILRKMHSILDIIPGRSIRVYHRSFFEFLQHPARSGDYCIAYPVALLRFLILLSRAVFRHAFKFRRYSGQLEGDDKKRTERIRNMVIAYPQNFFGRSVNPTKLATFHAIVHSFVILFVWMFSCWLSLDFLDYLIISLVPLPCVLFVQYLLIMSIFIITGLFIPFLMCYLSHVYRSIVRYPLFHPFLHPFFVKTSEFFLSGSVS